VRMIAIWFPAIWTLIIGATLAVNPRFNERRSANQLGLHDSIPQFQRTTGPPLNFRSLETLVVQNANTTSKIMLRDRIFLLIMYRVYS
jgi:hypothetical protein